MKVCNAKYITILIFVEHGPLIIKNYGVFWGHILYITIWFKSLIPVAKILLILQLELKITLMY